MPEITKINILMSVFITNLTIHPAFQSTEQIKQTQSMYAMLLCVKLVTQGIMFVRRDTKEREE